MVYQWNGRSCVLAIVFLILMQNVTYIGGFASLTLGPVLNIVPNSSFRAPLMESDAHRVGKRMDLESCLGQFDVHKNTIIRTGESQAIGGKYLQGLELETLTECRRLCCETETCDVFIFENKNYAYCYLFDCGRPENFHCKFTRHANYTSAVLVRHNTDVTTPPPTPPNTVISNISQQEWELVSLKAKPELRTGGSLEDGVPGPSLPTMQVVAEVENGSSPKTVSTTHVCGRFQFTCHSGECIAVYNACDGIPQCEDGSDEGPECSGAPASTINAESVGLKSAPDYQPVLLQEQLQSMQQRPLQAVLLAPTQINNREDAAAWANRKIISDSADPMRLGSSNAVHRKFDPLQPTFPNANAHIGGFREPVYAKVPVPPSQNAAPYFTQANNLFAPPPQQFSPTAHLIANPSITWAQSQPLPQQPLIASPVSSAIAVQLQPQGNLQLPHQRLPTQFHTNSLAIPSQSVTDISKSTVVPKGSSTKVPDMIDIKISHGTEMIKSPLPFSHDKETVNEYEDYVDSSTEQPPKKKQHKHKTVKAKIIDKEYSEEKTHHSPAPAPMHEQYKMIHDNLAVEFRDHEGLSTRPGGAVLSLTLGLLVTAALAIIIGCRIRTVNRRVRRAGKTPYSHEADFLVNGMYL